MKLGASTWDSVTDTGAVKVTVINHSSKRSDYMITIALESADGKTQLDTADVFVQNLEAGQSTPQQAIFLSLNTKPPATAKLTLKSVDRTAAS